MPDYVTIKKNKPRRIVMGVHNIVRRILFTAAALLVAFFVFDTAGSVTYAGFGDFNDYDYGGGNDWDDDDWGNDRWDNDYDRGYSYSYGTGGYSNTAAASIPVVVTVIVVIIAYSVLISKKKGTVTVKKYKTVSTKAVRTLPDRTDEIVSIMKQKDVNFTANDFLSYVKRVYIDIQDAWSKRDLEPVRSVLHPNLYQQTQTQIDKKIADGIVNHIERISVNTAYLTGYRQDDDYEYMTVYLAAQMIDYQVKEETGEVLYGDKTTRWDMRYKMTFIRAIDMQTLDITEENNETMRCPSCGAPIEGTAFGRCEYCGTVVSTGKYGWVLSDFGVVRDDTRDEGIHLKTQQ